LSGSHIVHYCNHSIYRSFVNEIVVNAIVVGMAGRVAPGAPFGPGH
jgi:hypothetical protein